MNWPSNKASREEGMYKPIINEHAGSCHCHIVTIILVVTCRLESEGSLSATHQSVGKDPLAPT